MFTSSLVFEVDNAGPFGCVTEIDFTLVKTGSFPVLATFVLDKTGSADPVVLSFSRSICNCL